MRKFQKIEKAIVGIMVATICMVTPVADVGMETIVKIVRQDIGLRKKENLKLL